MDTKKLVWLNKFILPLYNFLLHKRMVWRSIIIYTILMAWICHNLFLQALLEEVRYFDDAFASISFRHVYRENNGEVDFYSKEGLLLKKGEWVLFYSGTVLSFFIFLSRGLLNKALVGLGSKYFVGSFMIIRFQRLRSECLCW